MDGTPGGAPAAGGGRGGPHRRRRRPTRAAPLFPVRASHPRGPSRATAAASECRHNHPRAAVRRVDTADGRRVAGQGRRRRQRDPPSGWPPPPLRPRVCTRLASGPARGGSGERHHPTADPRVGTPAESGRWPHWTAPTPRPRSVKGGTPTRPLSPPRRSPSSPSRPSAATPATLMAHTTSLEALQVSVWSIWMSLHPYADHGCLHNPCLVGGRGGAARSIPWWGPTGSCLRGMLLLVRGGRGRGGVFPLRLGVCAARHWQRHVTARAR